jgi:phenylpyruvate tautomerase PptA (4-oxalocrotonate tautomerase family)
VACPVSKDRAGVLHQVDLWTCHRYGDHGTASCEFRAVQELAPQTQEALSNVEGQGNYVRVQVLTNAGALDRDKQLAVVSQFTDLISRAANDPSLSERTWVLLTEAIEGGWGLWGHAHTNAELVEAARAQIAQMAAAKTLEGDGD